MFDLYSETELDNIRSLGKFYESIPDYYDIHHLSRKDFNNTLERLKETSTKFKAKQLPSNVITYKEKNKNQLYSSKETLGNDCSERTLYNISCTTSTSLPKRFELSKKNTRGLKNEQLRSSGIKKSYSLSHLYEDIRQLKINNELNSVKSNCKDSQNEILPEKSSKNNKIKTTFPKTYKKNVSASLSNKTPDEIIFNKYSSSLNLKKKRKLQISNTNKFLFLGLNLQKSARKSCDTISKSNSVVPSPLYPAARLNLAATLRAEISHKKKHEQNNSTNFRPKKIQNKFDWEVRKSPGWKTLTYVESNKDDLLYRLETRRAEEKLQSQQFKTNMELMRQRVKSAPLLLEGITYWNSRFYNNKFSNSGGSGKQSRLSAKCKYIKNSKNETKNTEHNNQNVDSDDLSSEDRALL